MKQRRITDYFALPRPNPTQTLSFLDLPLPVRARIYRHTDATNHFIDLNFAGLVVHPPQKTSDGVQHDQLARIKCVCYEYCFEINTPMRSLNGDATLDEHEVVTSDDEFFFGIERMCHAPKKRGGWIEGCGFDETAFNLLLSCKSIHKDLEPIIYAENTFRVCQGNPHGFERLRRMSDRAIASLKTLTIRLTLPHAYNKADVSWFSQLDRLRTIGTSGPCDEMMMTDWKDVVSRFSKLLESGRLELGVIFRSGSENIVTTLAPLLDLPPLKNFTVFPINPSLSPASGRREFRCLQIMSDGSLSKPRSPDSASGVSADRTVDSIIRRLTNPPVHSQSPFRFLDLPAEIRLMILEQAGLNPTDEIRWSPGNCLCRECLCDQVFSDDMIHTTSTCPLGERTLRTVWHGYCCGECEIPNADNRSDLCYCVKFGYRRSSRCRCAHVPALFLVNRQISADAMSLYYSRKRHIVYPPHYRSLQYCSNAHYCGQDADYSITKTELSLYLSAITRSALHRLTSLEWIVPYWAPTRLATRKSIYECHGWLVPESVTKIYWHDYLDTVDMMEHAMDLQNLTLIFNCSWVWQVWPAQNFLQNKEQPGREHCLNLVYPIRKLASAGLANFRVRSRSPRFQSDICTALESEMECLVMSAKYDTVTDIN